MQRILVTGASGFVGRQVLDALQDCGAEVFAVSRSAPAHSLDKARWAEEDLLAPDGPKNVVARFRPTHLIHLGWCATPGTFLTSPENIRWLEASLELLQVFAECGGERFVGVGSGFEYLPAPDSLCKEDVTPVLGSTLYGATKQALGTVCLQAGDTLGLRTAWVRLFHLYGPHEHAARLVPAVCLSVINNQEIRLSSGSRRLDYISVTDASKALAAIAMGSVSGAVNVGSGEVVTVRAVAERIAASRKKENLLLFAPPLDEEQMPLLAPDITKLRTHVTWQPSMTLDEGLEATLEWWERQTLEQRNG